VRERRRIEGERERATSPSLTGRERVLLIYICVCGSCERWRLKSNLAQGYLYPFYFGEKRGLKKKKTTNIRREFSGVEPKDFLLVAK